MVTVVASVLMLSSVVVVGLVLVVSSYVIIVGRLWLVVWTSVAVFPVLCVLVGSLSVISCLIVWMLLIAVVLIMLVVTGWCLGSCYGFGYLS